ncbi:MAG: hypothetical protein LRY63_02920 [Nitrincola sp.]|nr:hypothetical protein [Nitrincola sp.]
MMKLLTLILIGIFLSACSSVPRTKTFWHKEGVSLHDAENAFAECQFKVGMNRIEGVAERNDLVRSCMTMQGYRWERYRN